MALQFVFLLLLVVGVAPLDLLPKSNQTDIRLQNRFKTGKVPGKVAINGPGKVAKEGPGKVATKEGPGKFTPLFPKMVVDCPFNLPSGSTHTFTATTSWQPSWDLGDSYTTNSGDTYCIFKIKAHPGYKAVVRLIAFDQLGASNAFDCQPNCGKGHFRVDVAAVHYTHCCMWNVLQSEQPIYRVGDSYTDNNYITVTAYVIGGYPATYQFEYREEPLPPQVGICPTPLDITFDPLRYGAIGKWVGPGTITAVNEDLTCRFTFSTTVDHTLILRVKYVRHSTGICNCDNTKLTVKMYERFPVTDERCCVTSQIVYRSYDTMMDATIFVKAGNRASYWFVLYSENCGGDRLVGGTTDSQLKELENSGMAEEEKLVKLGGNANYTKAL